MAHTLSSRWAKAPKKRNAASNRGAKSQSKQISRSVLILGVISLAVLLVLAVVWKNVQCVDMGYRIARLESQLDQNRQLNSELVVEYEMLASSERIERIAKDELGMVPAKVYGPVPLATVK